MRTVTVKAVNLKCGDVISGERICRIVKHLRRHARLGILVLSPHPKGYKLNVRQFADSDIVKVRRPKYNYGR